MSRTNCRRESVVTVFSLYQARDEVVSHPSVCPLTGEPEPTITVKYSDIVSSVSTTASVDGEVNERPRGLRGGEGRRAIGLMVGGGR